MRSWQARVGFGVILAATGCSSPTDPQAGGPSRTLATSLISPADGAVVPYFSYVRLVARNAMAPEGGVVLLTFEIDTTDKFAAPFFAATTPQSPGDQTEFSVQLSYSEAAEGKRVFWRVRAGVGETLGPPSRAHALVTGPRTDSPQVLFADPPVLVSPSNGAEQSQNPVLIARETAHSSGPTDLRFDWARDPGFTTSQPCSNERLTAPGVHSCALSRLSPGTYYWRARTATTRAGSSLAEGYWSAYSPVWSFTVQSVDIRRAEFVAPVHGDMVHPQPTFVVTNASRTGDVGPMTYRFSILTDWLYGTGRTVMTATVPEGAGQTSWTVPQDLMIETPYYASVVAVDTRSGFEGIPTQSGSFRVVPRSWDLRQLRIDTSCRSSVESAASEGAFTGPAVRVRTFRTLGLELRRGFDWNLSGSIGGYGTSVDVKGNLGGTASTVATLGSDGVLRGIFDGVVSTPTSIEVPFVCQGTGFRWSLR